MPSADAILVGLARIADEAFLLAVGWHVVLLVAVIALLAGWRPSKRRAALLLAALPGSVAALAIAYGNPFNGATFGTATVLMVERAARLPVGRVEAGPTWRSVVGVVMVAFGWVYPHFLRTGSPAAYLIGAPMGLVPCPSLAVAIGFTLLAGGFQDRSWSCVVGVLGLMYGLFGAVSLAVRLDVGLVLGATALLAMAFLPTSGVSLRLPRSAGSRSGDK